MRFLVFCAAVISFASAGIIQQDSDEGSHYEYHTISNHDHDDRPTSYQNIHIKHYHPVPVYVKKEHKHLLEHPVSAGQSSSNLEIHHGGKHDHGYAYGDSKQSSFDESGGDGDDGGSYGSSLESEGGNYENSEQQNQEEGDQSHYGQLAEQYGGENLGHYQEEGNSEDETGNY